MSRGHEKGTEVPYWPYQTIRNLMVVALMLAVISTLAWRFGAPLDATADATLPHTPRPEWYFLFLFELRGYFSGEWEFIATSVLPLAALVVLLAMPLLDRILPTRLSIAVRVLVVVGGVAAWGGLTWAALTRDWKDPEYLASREVSAQLAERARELADLGPFPRKVPLPCCEPTRRPKGLSSSGPTAPAATTALTKIRRKKQLPI